MGRSRPRRSLALLVGAVLAGGCASQRPVTEILLVVDAEESLRDAASTLQVRVWGSSVGGTADVVFDRTVPRVELRWPVSLGIVPRANDATRGLRAEAIVTSMDGTTTRASARTSYLPDETRVLRLALVACCTDVACTDTETCAACACTSNAIDPRTLPVLAGDAGP